MRWFRVSAIFFSLPLAVQSSSLKLPENFDPVVAMIGSRVNGKMIHDVRISASFAQTLLDNGSPEAVLLAEKVLGAVFSCQELRTGDPHFGGFWWTREDGFVEDLNGVQFVLTTLLSIWDKYHGRLSPSVRERLRASIHHGFEEVKRIDVDVAYTNIALMDIANSCIGGELLNDSELAHRGYAKLRKWMEFTDRSGGTYEYNSPPYTQVAFQNLSRLAKSVRDRETCVRAETMLARVGLSAALHIHPRTGEWAAPHGRVYDAQLMGRRRPSLELFKGWLADGTLQSWLGDAIEARPSAFQVVETTDREKEISTSTYHGLSFSIGTASRELSNQAISFIAWQSNPFAIHYAKDGGAGFGTAFGRYVLEEEWAGEFTPTPSRRSILFRERGIFHGAQDRERAIALYSSAEFGALSRHSSAKAIIVWPNFEPLSDAVWIGGRTVSALPVEVPEGATIVVVAGRALTAIRPLERTKLGLGAPLRVVRDREALILEMYNYLGPARTFWELASPGTFFQGRPKAGFYCEVAERDSYPDVAAFSQMVSSGVLMEKTDPPVTQHKDERRRWRVEYRRAGRSLGIDVDLMHWDRPAQRWTERGPMDLPMLESPVARQSRDGRVKVGDAELQCGKAPAWLFASPSTRRWVAGYHGPEEAPLRLSVPGGSVRLDSIKTGTVVWDNGKVAVSAIGVKGKPAVSGGTLSSFQQSPRPAAIHEVARVIQLSDACSGL